MLVLENAFTKSIIFPTHCDLQYSSLENSIYRHEKYKVRLAVWAGIQNTTNLIFYFGHYVLHNFFFCSILQFSEGKNKAKTGTANLSALESMTFWKILASINILGLTKDIRHSLREVFFLALTWTECLPLMDATNRLKTGFMGDQNRTSGQWRNAEETWQLHILTALCHNIQY